MHMEFRRLLENATSESEHVIAVNIDIRGFSAFCKETESPNVAVFIRKVYKKLIDEYFKDVGFFKPTGDGLLLVIPYTEEILEYQAAMTITACLNALKDFPSFCAGDPMINFEVPQKIGIGLSRGIACRLASEGKILDYSGRILNFASRLMDLARPSGIVFDAKFGIELVPKEVRDLFSKESVCLRGIAEIEPIEILYTKDYTEISPLDKKPLRTLEWRTVRIKYKLKKYRHVVRVFYPLPSEPSDPNQIKIKLRFPYLISGERAKRTATAEFHNFKYSPEAGKPRVEIRVKPLVKLLDDYHVRDDWRIVMEILYPEAF